MALLVEMLVVVATLVGLLVMLAGVAAVCWGLGLLAGVAHGWWVEFARRRRVAKIARGLHYPEG